MSIKLGICMECGKEFCRVTESHATVDCINNLKALVEEHKSRIKELEDEVCCEHQAAVDMFCKYDETKDLLEEYKRVVEPLKKEVEYLSTMWHKCSKLEGALIRARDQLAMYRADYSVQQINKVLESND